MSRIFLHWFSVGDNTYFRIHPVMAYETSTAFSVPEQYPAALLDAMPGNCALLRNDDPGFSIVAATPGFLKQTNQTKITLIGQSIFEVFPGNGKNPEDKGKQDLLLSLRHVAQTKETHYLNVQGYDVQNEAGEFAEKYWRVCNAPVLGPDGAVVAIAHTVEDLTAHVTTEKAAAAQQELEQAYTTIAESQQNLQAARQRIIDLLESTTDAFYALDADFNFTYVNKRAAQLWGRSPESIVGKNFWAEFPNVKGSESHYKHYEALHGGKPVHYEAISPVLGIWVEANIYPGSNGGLSVFFRDIAERKAAEASLRESEAKYRTLFESMDQGFCILEMIFDAAGQPTDYRFVEANPVFEQQSGLKDAVGKTARELVPNLEARWLERYGHVALTGASIHFTEGSKAMGRWFDVFAYRMGNEGAYKVALLFTDITERKNAEEAILQSEANLRNMILQSPVAMAILRGPSFVVEIANDRMFELWGKEIGSLLNKPIFEGLPEVKNQGYEELLNGVFTTGQSFSALGLPVTLPRGEGIETVYINLLYQAIREGDGTISGIMAVATDVTEQVSATQKIEEVVAARTKELARANEELKRSNQNLEEFAYAASHDLKEPIRKIHFFADRLKERLQGKLENEDFRYFERLQTGAKRMSSLIDDLLLYSHVSRGAVLAESVDLNQKVKTVLEDLELEIQEMQATVTVGPLPEVKGSRRQLQQMFQNLIGNAIKYNKPGVPPEVGISCRKVSRDQIDFLPAASLNDTGYLIEVRDNGIGFQQEDAERIFNVFTRLHGNAEYKGTGVGLSIVRKVVENHGGVIWAESLPGTGSVFKILLPAHEYVQ